jgi:cytolysin (calcineurin-like family phosphatase)
MTMNHKQVDLSRLALCLALTFGLAESVLAASSKPAARKPRDVTFILTSDSHYSAFTNEDRNVRDSVTLRQMNAITNLAWPEKIGSGTIARPRGVLVLGDLIDDGDRMAGDRNQSRQEFEYCVGDFGLDGTDGLLNYRVYEGWGNHDGPPVGREKFGFSYQAQLRQRNLLRQQKGWLAALSTNGLHYSWDWDDVHFVQLGIYPADQQNPLLKRYDPKWHDPQGALTFLKEDLARQVGTSGHPVVLVSHCGFDTDWWLAEDWKAAYEVVKPYNVILYAYGHTGTGLRQWAPAGETKLLNCVNTGQTEKGFFIVQIKADSVRLAYREKAGMKVIKNPDKTTRVEWEGAWGWGLYSQRILK